MRRGLLLLSILAPACVYQAQSLPLCTENQGLGPCGPGERCELQNDGEVCSCGGTYAVGGPACRAGQLCHPQAFCNTPPVAVISGTQPVSDTPTLELAAGTNVFADGGASFDADPGTTLAFAWSTSCSLDTSVEPVFRLDSANLQNGCVLTLTVSDGLDETTASAQVVLRDVGAYVANSNPVCLPVGGVTLGGTPSLPWCTIGQGIAAALAYNIATVVVSADAYTEDVTVPPLLMVDGGYAPGAWNKGSQRTSLSVARAEGVAFSHGAGASLVDFSVGRAAACASDCALVSADDGASLTLVRCTLGGNTGAAPSAPGYIHRNLEVTAGAGNSVQVNLVDVTVMMADDAAASYGVYLDGRGGNLDGSIVNLFVSFSSDNTAQPQQEVAGIRLLGTNDLNIDGPMVSIYDFEPAFDRVFGLLDGAVENLTVEGCGGAGICAGSRRLSITSGTFNITNYGALAAGLGLFGSEESSVRAINPALLQAQYADAAVGLWTAGTRKLVIAGGQTRLTSRGVVQNSGLAPSFGAGLVDGLPNLVAAGTPWLTFSGSSTELDLDGLDMSGAVDPNGGSTGPVALAGAMLFGTSSSRLNQIGFDVMTMQGQEPELAAGLWTVGTDQLSVTDSQFGASGSLFGARRLVAAYYDGAYLPNSARPASASTGLLLSGNSLTAQFFAVGGAAALRACLLLVGTDTASLGGRAAGEGNAIACTDPVEMGQVIEQALTLDTRNVQIIGNVFNSPDPATGVTPLQMEQIAIRDGGLSVGGSAGLRIDANRIYGPRNPPYERFTGVLIHQEGMTLSDSEFVNIANNVVFATAGTLATALRIEDADAVLANNSLYGGTCLSRNTGNVCSMPAYSVGVSLLPNPAKQVVLVNNLLHGGDAAQAYALIDGGANLDGNTTFDTGESLGMGMFAHNALRYGDGTTQQYIFFHAGGAGVVPPTSGQSFDGSKIVALLASIAQRAAPAPDLESWAVDAAKAGVCATDGYHLRPDGTARSWLINRGVTNYRPLDDIDGDQRTDPAPDVGADEALTLLCP